MSKNFIETIKDYEFIDFRFTDVLGTWHHISFPLSEVDEGLLKDGIPFDGSSIPGWKAVNESDMILMPDLKTLVADPFSAHATAIIVCDVYDPTTNQPYNRDPRSIAKKAESYIKASGLADTAYFGPEAEFFVFDEVQFQAGSDASFFHLFSEELPYASGKEPNSGYRPGHKGGYMPCAPIDTAQDMRSDMVLTMAAMGLSMEKHHHEVATAQHELGFKFGTLTSTADALQIYKYVVRNVAKDYGRTATFMPKPLYGDNGSGMHVHQSLWQNGEPLFAGSGYAGLSQTALYYIGGIIKHAKAINAFTNPTTNSYKRLIPGFEAPVICAYSARNRSAACRIPMAFNDKGRRVEVRFPDPTACGYLGFAAMLLAGLDGIKNSIDPGTAADQNLFEEADAAKRFPTVAGSLREALNALEHDYEFLCQGNVFTPDFIQSYIDLKFHEVHAFEHAPHPIEFTMYYNG
ncbi:MAG: type I glutamate--ammonia ligase [Alphaproteobacteria bacterium]|nr:type I glutamate--ammonia ligase [Alphaproteobacteria bacterium]